MQKKEEVAEDKKKYAKKIYGDHTNNDSDQGFFGGGSTNDPFSDDSEKASQPYTGQCVCFVCD